MECSMKTKTKKKQTRVAWTPAHIRELKKLAKTKIGVAKIARQLKRTPAAVAVVASKHGISLSTR